MVACFRLGARRAAVHRAAAGRATCALRLAVAQPRLVVCDERNLDVLGEAAGPAPTVLVVPWRRADRRAEPAAGGRARRRRPVPDHVHVRHRGRAEGGPARPALPRRPARCRPSTGSRPARATSSGAPPPRAGRSPRATSFIAPWLRGAAALLHDARFDPHERLELLERERVDVLCMAPTEYRVIAKRATLRPFPALRGAGRRRRGAQPRGPARLARGDRALDPRRLRPDRDRPAHRHAARRARRGPGSMGRAAARRVGSTSSTASSSPTPRPSRRSSSATSAATPAPGGPWRTGDRVAPRRRRLPVLRGPPRRRDHLRRLPDRPVRGRVRARRPRRGRRGGGRGGARRGARQRRARGRRAARRLRALRRARRASSRTTSRPQTAPYKYPRVVDFADELPKTASGKVRRAALRDWISRPATTYNRSPCPSLPAACPHTSPPSPSARRRGSSIARGGPASTSSGRTRVMPGGVPSSFQRNDPWPIYIDARPRRRRCGTSTATSTSTSTTASASCASATPTPSIAAAVKAQMDEGTHFAAPTEGSIVVAEELRRRWGLPHWRFTNSGTESTMDAVHLARGAHRARRDREDRGHLPRPPRRRDGLGQAAAEPDGRRASTRAAIPYGLGYAPGDRGADARRPVQRRRGGRARARSSRATSPALILEPAMMNINIVPPVDGYLERVRELTHAARRRR